MGEKQKSKSQKKLHEQIKRLKKRIKDLERERDILLALHRKDTDWQNSSKID